MPVLFLILGWSEAYLQRRRNATAVAAQPPAAAAVTGRARAVGRVAQGFRVIR
jgi:hypothetical protein